MPFKELALGEQESNEVCMTNNRSIILLLFFLEHFFSIILAAGGLRNYFNVSIILPFHIMITAGGSAVPFSFFVTGYKNQYLPLLGQNML